MAEKKRGATEGPIRIPLDSLSFLFNALEFPSIPSKSLKFRPVVFSILTAPTSFLIHSTGLAKTARRQKAALSQVTSAVEVKLRGTDGKPT